MIVFVALVLTALTFAFITYPLFKQRLRSVDSVEGGKSRELYFQRDTTYSMLKELEFDFQSGTLTEEDYRDLEARYKEKAISILKGIDDLEKGTDVEAEIERLVLELRRGKGASVDADVEKEILESRRGEDRFCPQCGAERQENGRFCSDCGARLSREETS